MKGNILIINGPFFHEWYYTETETKVRFLKLNRTRNDISGLPVLNKVKRLRLLETYQNYCERKGYNDKY